jgi:hypothetical protein
LFTAGEVAGAVPVFVGVGVVGMGMGVRHMIQL